MGLQGWDLEQLNSGSLAGRLDADQGSDAVGEAAKSPVSATGENAQHAICTADEISKTAASATGDAHRFATAGGGILPGMTIQLQAHGCERRSVVQPGLDAAASACNSAVGHGADLVHPGANQTGIAEIRRLRSLVSVSSPRIRVRQIAPSPHAWASRRGVTPSRGHGTTQLSFWGGAPACWLIIQLVAAFWVCHAWSSCLAS